MPSRIYAVVVIYLVLPFGLLSELYCRQPEELVLTGDAAAKAFVYEDKPIHPACFEFNLDSDVTKLSSCADSKLAVTQRNGWLETDFPENPGEFFLYRPFVSYRVFAKKGNSFLIATNVSGGGSGIFDSLFWTEMDGGALRAAKAVTGGDRCGRGTGRDYSMHGTSLIFSQNLTPAEMIKLASPGPVNVSLEDSATSCFGLAHYEYDVVNGKLKLTSVTLAYDLDPTNTSHRVEEDPEWAGRFKHQSCFNTVFNRYVDARKTELDESELKSFGEDFLSTCVTH